MNTMARLPAVVVRGAVLSCCALGAISYSTQWRKSYEQEKRDSIRNYQLVFQKPAGWKELPHGPQTLFIYECPKTGLLYRGSINNIVADINPTPGMTGDRIADTLLVNTRENMPGWSGERIHGENTEVGEWGFVQRKGQGKIVVSAFASKGNSTLVIAMVADQPKLHKAVDGQMPHFREFVKGLKVRPKQYEDFALR